MARIRNLVLMLAVVLVMVMLAVSPAFAAYNLVWSDEFDGTSLNTSNWTYETGGGGWGNNELEYYTAGGNLSISGGICTITAKKESMGGYAYTSTRMNTKGKRQFQYGKIEARLALPMGKGLWPAFWMLGANFPGTAWPNCGEIDIMEHINTETQTHGTIHWDTNGYANYGGPGAVADPAAFHVYSIEWTSAYIRWFIDGAQFWEANILNSINGTEEFHKPFFIIMNFAVGGNWPGSPDASTPFPSTYKIDYVRVYQDNGAVATPTATRTPSPGVTATATKTPSGGTLPSTTWYQFNTAVSGVSPAGQNMQTSKSGTTGWQPTKTINTTSSYWYSTPVTGTYKAGTYTFYLWTNNPGASSQVTVEIAKVNSDGSGVTVLGTQTKEAGTSASGNHATTYTFSVGSVALSNQRLRVRIVKSSGVDLTMAYNTNDFPTRLVTP